MKLIITSFLTFLFIIFSVQVEKPDDALLPNKLNIEANPVYAMGCTMCDDATQDECHRVIVGKEVHIYYGNEKDCPEEEEQLP